MTPIEFIWPLFLIGSVSLLAAMSPGPDFILVTKHSLLGSRRAGIYTALGVGIGVALYGLLALLGMVAIWQDPFIYQGIKYIGSIYLLFLGIQLVVKKQDKLFLPQLGALLELSAKKSIIKGFLGNILNPKAGLFVFSIFSQIVPPDQTSFYKSIVALEITLVTLGWFVALVFLLTSPKIRQKFLYFQPFIRKIMGLLLIFLGIQTAIR